MIRIPVLLAGFLAAIACASPAAVAGKPDFSGNWKLDAARSSLGPLPGSYTLTRKVTHTVDRLSIVESQYGGPGDPKSTQQYTMDGKVSINTFMTIPVECTSVWDGESLVMTMKADAEGFPFKRTDRWTLSADGNVLTSVVSVHGGDGDFTFTFVLRKEQGPRAPRK